MVLKIYDVAYYTKEHGEIKEISELCQALSEYVRDKSYSKMVNYIRIGPVAAPREVLQKGLWKEFNRVWGTTGDASVISHMDYDMYVNAPIEEKKKMIIENVLLSIKRISQKGKIDLVRFKEDIIHFCGLNGVNYTL